jgi:hypothetical protein
MRAVSPLGLVGRVIAAVGAVVMGASIFLDIVEGGGQTYLDVFRRTDIVILVLAGAAVVLLLISLLAVDAEVACLFGVGLVGGYGLGFFTNFFIEQTFDRGMGTWLGNVGAAATVLGAGIALLPAMMGRQARPSRDTLFAQAEPAQAHAPAQTVTPTVVAPSTPTREPEATPAPASEPILEPEPTPPPASTIPAGWYPDPSGQARLRYWNGDAWTEQTQH